MLTYGRTHEAGHHQIAIVSLTPSRNTITGSAQDCRPTIRSDRPERSGAQLVLVEPEDRLEQHVHPDRCVDFGTAPRTGTRSTSTEISSAVFHLSPRRPDLYTHCATCGEALNAESRNYICEEHLFRLE